MTTDNTNNALNKINLKETEKINNLLVQFVFKEYFLNNDTSTFSHNNLNQKKFKNIHPNIDFSIKNGKLTIENLTLFSQTNYLTECNPILERFYDDFSSHLKTYLFNISDNANTTDDEYLEQNLLKLMLKSDNFELNFLALNFLYTKNNFIEYFKHHNDQELIFDLVINHISPSNNSSSEQENKDLSFFLNFMLQHSKKFLDPIPADKILDLSKNIDNIFYLQKIFHHTLLTYTSLKNTDKIESSLNIYNKITEILLDDKFKYTKEIFNITQTIFSDESLLQILNKLNVSPKAFKKSKEDISLSSFTNHPTLKTDSKDMVFVFEILPTFFSQNPDYAQAFKDKKFKIYFHSSQIIFPKINNRSCMIQLLNQLENPKFILTIHDINDFPLIKALNKYNHPPELHVPIIENELQHISEELYEMVVNAKYALSQCINNTIVKYLDFNNRLYSNLKPDEVAKEKKALISISNDDIINAFSHVREKRLFEKLDSLSKDSLEPVKKIKI